MKGIIYKATNQNNGKVYIGQTIRPISYRIQEHLRASEKNIRGSFYNAIRKYKNEVFTWSIIEVIEDMNRDHLVTRLNSLEIFYISKYQSYSLDYGYNMTKGGENNNLNSCKKLYCLNNKKIYSSIREAYEATKKT